MNGSLFLRDGMADIQVRIATESDATLLARFRYELRSSLDHVIENEEPFIERCTVWMQERLRGQSTWKCWIAECKKEAVGTAWAQLIEKIPNPASEAEFYVYLTNFYVREKYRAKGIGSILLSAALGWAKTNDVHTVILWPTEQSRRWYLRHGFSDAYDLLHLMRGDS
jgi:GNAT superfamily N-acetyltransferase